MGNSAPVYAQRYVLVGPATAALREGVLRYDDIAERDRLVRELVGRDGALVEWSDNTHPTSPMRLFSGDTTDFHLPVNEWVFPLRGAIVYMHGGLGGAVGDKEGLFRHLEARRLQLETDLWRRSLLGFGGDAGRGCRWIDEIKQAIRKDRVALVERFSCGETGRET